MGEYSPIPDQTLQAQILPYGLMFLALTWGLIHILLQGGATGIYAFFMSLLYGKIYIMLRKNVRDSY